MGIACAEPPAYQDCMQLTILVVPGVRRDDDVDEFSMHVRILAARCARVLIGFTLENKRAQGMPGARCTRGLVRNGEWMRARAYGLSGGIRHPLRNGFTAYAVLSPAIGLV